MCGVLMEQKKKNEALGWMFSEDFQTKSNLRPHFPALESGSVRKDRVTLLNVTTLQRASILI